MYIVENYYVISNNYASNKLSMPNFETKCYITDTVSE